MNYKDQAKRIISEFPGFYLQLDLGIPSESLLEAQRVYDAGLFAHHTPSLPDHPAGGGWYASCLHGIGWDKVVSSHAYGYENNYGDWHVPMNWTEVCELAPETTRFFKEEFPLMDDEWKYKRVRFMLLKPGGIVPPHFDETVYGRGTILKSVTIPLNQPENCYLKHHEKDVIIPFEPFKTMLVDNSIMHSGANNSNEFRFHVLVQHYGNWRDDFWKMFVDSFEKNYDGNIK